MLKGVVSGVALTLAVALIGAYALVQSGFIPANADAKPGRLETWMARTSLYATLHRDAPKDQNPVAVTDQNLINGVNLFAQNCAVCHGTAMGVTSSSPIAKGLYQKPPQLATDGVEDDPEGGLRQSNSINPAFHNPSERVAGLEQRELDARRASIDGKDTWAIWFHG